VVTATLFGEEALDFYRGLLADNSKSYWTAHKHAYERAVREPMRRLLDALASEFDAEPVVFRPYRDVRFSRDKSPYKTHQGALLQVRPGTGYWLQLDAEGALVGGGFHAQSRDETARFRAAVDDNESGSRLVAILALLTGYDIEGDQVRTRPRGVPADHPRLDLMRREFLTVARGIAPSTLTTDAVRADWTRLRPLVAWIVSHVGSDGT
jgi:uncharacterized protein (TIGR02453 family)